jgi:lambda repressor-like predicted transcriptional regulator
MYGNLMAEMARNGLSARDLSVAVGVTYDTMLSKLNGKRDFKLSEMKTIQKLFGQTLDYLFKEGG